MDEMMGSDWGVCVRSRVTDLLVEVADQQDPTGPRLSSERHPACSSRSRRRRAQRVQGS